MLKQWLIEQDLKRNNKEISQIYQYESIMVSIESFGMTTTAAPTVNEEKLVSFGLVESASVNSFADFIPSKSNESKVNIEQETRNENEDFKNEFICHMIFYAVLCFSIILHILIDLGLGSFIKNKFIQLMESGKKILFEKTPAFA